MVLSLDTALRTFNDSNRDSGEFAGLREIVENAQIDVTVSWMEFEKRTIKGNPDKKNISTSYVERQNLTMRMHMRRFTRLTNGFSKKVENHIAAVSLRFMYYNFVRIHQTLKVTPGDGCWCYGSALGDWGYCSITGRAQRAVEPPLLSSHATRVIRITYTETAGGEDEEKAVGNYG